MKKKFNIMTALMMFLIIFVNIACSDDNNTGGIPQITGVKILSSDTVNYNYNESYIHASAGTMIAIMGQNLSGATHLYINDQPVNFNSTMNTNTSLVCTIPREEDGFRLSTFDSNIPDEIRIETHGGVASYSFKVTAPYPQFNRIEAVYPRTAGTRLTLYGMNMVDVQQMYITDAMPALLDTTKWETVPGRHYPISEYNDIMQNHYLNDKTNAYETVSVMEATVPAEVPDSGAFVVEMAAGIVYLPFSVLPGKPAVLGISSDMPQIGERFYITGRDFVQVSSIKYGDITLTPEDFVISDSQDTIYVTNFRKPLKNSGTTLSVSTIGGTGTYDGNFYDYSTLLTTFDGDTDVTDGEWNTLSYIDSGNADGKYLHFNYHDDGGQDWSYVFAVGNSTNGFALSENIPEDADLDHIYLAYNVYDAGDHNNGKYQGYMRWAFVQNQNVGESWMSFMSGQDSSKGRLHEDANGEIHKNQWYRAVIPLSRWEEGNFNLQSWYDIKSKGIYHIIAQPMFSGSVQGDVNLKIDNIRIIYIP